MKAHPDLTTAAILQDMMESLSPEDITKVSGGPETPQERVDAFESMKKALKDHFNKVRTICAGCGDDMPMAMAKICVCGGFVCPGCEKVEEEGVCGHERPEIPGLDDEEEED